MFVFKETTTCEKEDIAKHQRIAIILKASQSEVKSAIVLHHLILFVKLFPERNYNKHKCHEMTVIIYKST